MKDGLTCGRSVGRKADIVRKVHLIEKMSANYLF
jgi:hypothetical protein